MPNINQTLKKSNFNNILKNIFLQEGSQKIATYLDLYKTLGFKFSGDAGFSIGIDDFIEIPLKSDLITKKIDYIHNLQVLVKNSSIDEFEYLKQLQNHWLNLNEEIQSDLLHFLKFQNLTNNLYIMSNSGARGNFSQINQLSGLRGLMADQNGNLIARPILTNFKEGLSPLDYIISSFGARKGIVDTALKTADSGYLTRRLVYTGINSNIKIHNCKTTQNQFVYSSFKDYNGLLCTGIIKNNNIILFKHPLVLNLLKELPNNIILLIRTPSCCKLNEGLCQICYGFDLSQNNLITLGNTVGITAAQSIGEPGTQLTMRTFHTGGVFSSLKNNNSKEFINYGGKLKSLKFKSELYNFNGKVFTLNKSTNLGLDTVKSYSINNNKDKTLLNSSLFPNKLNANFCLINDFYDNKDQSYKKLYINKKVRLIPFIKINKVKNVHYKFKFNLNLLNLKFIAKESGIFKKIHNDYFLNNTCIFNLHNLANNISINHKVLSSSYVDKGTELFTLNLECKNLLIYKDIKDIYSLNTRKNLVLGFINNTVLLPINTIEKNYKKSLLNKNNILYYTFNEKNQNEDIVQGLPKIEQLFEGRNLGTSNITEAILILCNNINKFKKDPLINKLFTPKKINICYNINNLLKEITYLNFNNNFNLSNLNLAHFKLKLILLSSIQSIYSSQGVNINSKHIETLLKEQTKNFKLQICNLNNFFENEILSYKLINLLINSYKKLDKTIPILGHTIYNPITKSLSKTEDFLTVTGFQETRKILINSALKGNIDWQKAIKSRMLFGKTAKFGTKFLQIRNQLDLIYFYKKNDNK